MRVLAVALIGLVSADVLLAQLPGVRLGAGVAHVAYEWMDGSGPQLDLSVPVSRWGGNALVRAEVSAQRADFRGSPFACTIVDDFYCLGRRDQMTMASARLVAVVDLVPAESRSGSIYLMPLLAGVAHLHATSHEVQGPTAICIIDGTIQSCPNNPPWASFERSFQRTGPLVGAGIGVSYRTRWFTARMEGRYLSVPGPERRGEMGSFTLQLSRS